MSEQPPLSLLFCTFTEWMLANGHKDVAKKPQPWRGELKVRDDILKLTFNASGNEVEGVPMYSLKIESTKYLAFAVVDPYGGALGGFNEDDLIEAFKVAKAV